MSPVREERRSREELEAIDRRRFWIVTTSLMALAVLAGAPFLGAPRSAVIVLVVVLLISVKKASVNYLALGERKTEILQSIGSGER